MATVREMIEALGGVRATGRALGLAPTTVSFWHVNNRVPDWREGALSDAYQRKSQDEAA